MRGNIFLNAKKTRRVYVMEQVLNGTITIRQAAQYLGLSAVEHGRINVR